MKGLSLFRRTSSRSTWNLASYHSPHSLTWRWIISLRRHTIDWPRPYATTNPLGFGAGIGGLLSLYAYRDNNGLQWECRLFWHGIAWSSQRPMWFKDMIQSAWDERDEAMGRYRGRAYSHP